jgi:y4mF family transcriptional regulator
MAKEELQSGEAIGKRIRELRRAQGITQAQLAGLANTGIRFIGDLEKGKETCHIGKILRVLSTLGVGMYIYSPYDKE